MAPVDAEVVHELPDERVDLGAPRVEDAPGPHWPPAAPRSRHLAARDRLHGTLVQTRSVLDGGHALRLLGCGFVYLRGLGVSTGRPSRSYRVPSGPIASYSVVSCRSRR